MQLVYRGHTYNAASAIEMPASAITGHYRGQTVAIKPTVGMRQSETVQLSYRGIRYTHTQ